MLSGQYITLATQHCMGVQDKEQWEEAQEEGVEGVHWYYCSCMSVPKMLPGPWYHRYIVLSSKQHSVMNA